MSIMLIFLILCLIRVTMPSAMILAYIQKV